MMEKPEESQWNLDDIADDLIMNVLIWKRQMRAKRVRTDTKANWTARFAYWLGQRAGAEIVRKK